MKIRIILQDMLRGTESEIITSTAVVNPLDMTIVARAPDGFDYIGVYQRMEFRDDYETYYVNYALSYPLNMYWQNALEDKIAQNLLQFNRTRGHHVGGAREE